MSNSTVTTAKPAKPNSQPDSDPDFNVDPKMLAFCKGQIGENAGLLLSGMVVGQNPEDRFNPKNDYRPEEYVRTYSVTDGEKAFKLSIKAPTKETLPSIPLFAAVKINVTYCSADKGNISVQGTLV